MILTSRVVDKFDTLAPSFVNKCGRGTYLVPMPLVACEPVARQKGARPNDHYDSFLPARPLGGVSLSSRSSCS